MEKRPGIVVNDNALEPYTTVIQRRIENAIATEARILGESKNLYEFASGHLFYGLHRNAQDWVFREWAPNATSIFLIGEFNDWQDRNEYLMQRGEHGNWEIQLPLDLLKHNQRYKLHIYWNGGSGYRIPSYAWRAVQDQTTKTFDAQVWAPEQEYVWKNKDLTSSSKHPLIYEAHIGMASEDEKVASYTEFRLHVLPRIQSLGYNTIQFMAIQEHPYYGSFGYHVSNFFAASSRFGTPEELKELIDEAHGMGIAVIMDIVHSHAVKNEFEGLGLFDGTGSQYFHTNDRREHVAWDSLCFNYGRPEVLHFLLSNCKFWLEEYKFDGFRFDGVTSMLYYDHGLGKNFTNYSQYYDGSQDEDAISYLMLANRLIKQINAHSITVAEEMSGMPGLASPQSLGGIGFDYRMAMGIPDYWIKLIKEYKDENWNIGELFYQLTSKRYDEQTISYAESHDQALVGDQTIIFRLVNDQMYYSMDRSMKNLKVERGIALHKMIRLITLATSGGGYLNFMGNEFGHPEWIDFPREGNGWSYKFARRMWSLSESGFLKYQLLNEFDRDMIQLIRNESVLDDQWIRTIHENEKDKIIVFERGNLLFVFSFNPDKSFTDYTIPIGAGKFSTVLCTDSEKYGGFGLVAENYLYYSVEEKLSKGNFLKLYIPARTGIVLKRLVVRSVYDV